ncbi:MAG: ClpP family protease [Planctomycetota bacterium]|jgi:ATP-dependent Clp protease protease subunit
MALSCDQEEGKEGLGRKLEERLLKSRTVILSQPIDDALARKVITQLIILEEDDPKKEITLVINSPGGSADSGFAIYDMARFISPPIRSLCSGLCASAAVIIFLAAEKGARNALPNSRFLLHQPSSAAMGAASDIAITAKEILALKNRYNQIVAKETGKTKEAVEKDANRDFWLSAKEAVAYGLVSKVVTTRRDL